MRNQALAPFLATWLASPGLLWANTTHTATPVSKGGGSARTSGARPAAVASHGAFPLHRAPPPVVRHGAAPGRIVRPRGYLPVVVCPMTLVSFTADIAVWQQGQNLWPGDGWTELDYPAPDQGSSLLMSFDEPVQFDFAEVVYGDGSSQVVDLSGPVRAPGTYDLLPLDPSRAVDHIRLIAQATELSTEVVLMAR